MRKLQIKFYIFCFYMNLELKKFDMKNIVFDAKASQSCYCFDR